MRRDQEPSPSNRYIRRATQRLHLPPLSSGKVRLRPLDEVLEEDDSTAYLEELSNARHFCQRVALHQRVYQIYSTIGVSDPTYRRYLLAAQPHQELYDKRQATVQAGQEIHQGKLAQVRGVLQTYENLLKRIPSIRGLEIDAWYELIADPEIPLVDIFDEMTRVSVERVGLLELQVEWEKTHPAAKQITTSIQSAPPDPESVIEKQPQMMSEANEVSLEVPSGAHISDVSEAAPYLLHEWSVYWTTTLWSSNPNHLIALDTSSRVATLAQLADLGRGKFMVKPSSILRALEFHLGKNVIQKALATRLKYGPREIREWIRLKRGRDRMGLLITDPQTVIFFASNRDDVYESDKLKS